MLNTLRHLLPDSTAWHLVIERTLKKYLRGIATVGSDVVDFIDDVYDDLWPDLTRELLEWQDQFGITTWPWSVEDDMRTYLDFRWGEDRGQSPKHLQDKLQAAGFDAYVYDSFDLADVSLTTYTGDSYALPAGETAPGGFCFGNSGRKLYHAGATGGAIYEHDLTEPYTLAGASFVQSWGVSAQDSDPVDVRLSEDGYKMLVLGGTNNAIYEYTLTDPWSLADVTYVDSMSVNAKETAPEGFDWKGDGTEVYVTGTGSDDLHQYSLGTGWDVSTGSFTRTYDPAVTDPTTVAFNDTGTKFYLQLTFGARKAYQYDLSTAWDISSASSSGLEYQFAEDSSPDDFYVAGTRLFMRGSQNDTVYRYRLGTWRDPLDYANQPIKGNVQCGETGASSLPIAECGEEPDDQTSIDSAVCNLLLANPDTIYYLWNNRLTQEAPSSLPTDESKWGPIWYVAGDASDISTKLELDEYERPRLEEVCLKHGPAEQYIVTNVERWTTTEMGLYDYETSTGTLDVGEWKFTQTTTTPMLVTNVDKDGIDWSTSGMQLISTGHRIRWEKTNGSGEWIEYELTAGGTPLGPPNHYSYPINVTPTAVSTVWTGLSGEMRMYWRKAA